MVTHIRRSKFRRGQTVPFTYKCFESEESHDAELWHHTNQKATVIRKLPKKDIDEHEVGRMYNVRFKDGFKYDVTEEELKPHKKQARK